MGLLVTCIAPGLTVSGIAAARTFAPGDVIDPAAVIETRPGGRPVTWRDVLGDHLASHFAPVQTSAEAEPVTRRRGRASLVAVPAGAPGEAAD